MVVQLTLFLALVSSFWWKNQQIRSLSAKSMNMYQHLRVFFNVKNLGIYSFFSNSDFTIKNLNLSQLWGSTQISITYSIKYTFWRLKKSVSKPLVYLNLRVRAYCSAHHNSRMLCNIASTATDRSLFYNNAQIY